MKGTSRNSSRNSARNRRKLSSKCQEAYCSRVERIYRGGKRSLGDLHDPSVARPVAMGPVTPTRPYKHRSFLPLCFAPGRATYLREDKFLSERRAASPYRRIMWHFFPRGATSPNEEEGKRRPYRYSVHGGRAASFKKRAGSPLSSPRAARSRFVQNRS